MYKGFIELLSTLSHNFEKKYHWQKISEWDYILNVDGYLIRLYRESSLHFRDSYIGSLALNSFGFVYSYDFYANSPGDKEYTNLLNQVLNLHQDPSKAVDTIISLLKKSK